MRGAHWAAGAAAVLTMAGCGSSAAAGGGAQAASASHSASASGRASGASPAASTGASATAQPPAPEVIVSRFRAADGSLVTLARFTGPVRYRLHSGSADPGSAALSVVQAGPSIRSRERSRLLAAFNGGFLLSTGAGGFEQERHVIVPLRAGLASLVIDRSGAGHVGVWGSGLPQPGEAVYSVRQNLQPLVRHGHPTPAAADWPVWGATLGGGEYVARSALGQTSAGDLIYAGSMSTSPADLAAALVHAGARTAMELDINPEWVQLDVARAAGHILRAAIPGQSRPANQYLVGWTRDFITVLG
jgi:hypothetical protein